MQIPPLDGVTRVIDALSALAPAVGGSGLLVALGLAELANDWDVTVDAPEADVTAALGQAGITYRDATIHEGMYATQRRYVIDMGDHDIDLLVGFALRGPDGIEHIPTRITRTWRGLPIGDPVVWARAYVLLGRTEKARILHEWLRNEPMMDRHRADHQETRRPS